MEYAYYKDAYDALVKDNDGVLPDLYEEVNFIIYCHPSNSVAIRTVADVVAHALVEVSTAKAAAPGTSPGMIQLPYVPTPTGELLFLDKLLDCAVVSLN